MPKRPSSSRAFFEKRARASGAALALVPSVPRVFPMRPGGFRSVRSVANMKEHKYVDVVAASYAADTTGTVTLLNGIAQGDDYNQRIGRQVLPTSISIKGLLHPGDTTSNECYCRCIIVWDSALNGGSAPAITDLLAASTSISHNNLNNRNRFKILADEQYAIGATYNTATQAYAQSPTIVTINRYIPMKEYITQYQGTGATAGSIQSGAIWMFTVGDQAPSAGGSFNVCTRVRYTDA